MSKVLLKEDSIHAEIRASQQFNKEIVTEDFYVLHEEVEENVLFELQQGNTTKVSIMEPERDKEEMPTDEEEFDLVEDALPEEEPLIKKTDTEEDAKLDKDFFEVVVDEDAEKKQVVKEIAGMTDDIEAETNLTEMQDEHTKAEAKLPDETAQERPKETRPSRRHSTIIQFKRDHGLEAEKEDAASVKSVDSSKEVNVKHSSVAKMTSTDVRRVSSKTRRVSGIPDLMKLSKKSLLALTGSVEGSVPPRKSVGSDERYRKDVASADLLAMSVPDYPASSRATSIKGSDSRRGTFYTELGPRYKQMDDEDLMAEFDLGGDAPIFFEILPEEEEDVIILEEEQAVTLERGPFYERHDVAAQEITIRKMKNYLFHKKLAMYFKRKKMDYVTKEVDWSFDSQNKYFRKLEAYGELMDFVKYEKARVNQELDETKTQREEKYRKLDSMFKKMQDREGEIGYGLINTKTGHALPDKFVERLIRRQNTQMTQVSSMRLTYIRLKGMVQEKLDGISSLDEIAPGFLLVDYEQLKSDNRAYADKIEEKDEELTRLRAKCGSTIQILAHLREKTSALDNDVEDLVDMTRTLDQNYFVVRSTLNDQKQYRDTVRHALNKMRDDSGLLTQPTLLKDMERGLAEFKVLTDQLNHIMKEHKKKAGQIKTIRERIEENVDLRRGLSKKSLTKLCSNTQRTISVRKDKPYKIYKGRPSLMLPVIKDDVFDSLRTIKPKLTYDKSLRSRSKVKQNKRTGG